jgi:hypothetical protein
MDLQTASSTARARRRSLRRAVQLEVEVMSDLWHGTVPLVATNLSVHGAWLESELALSVGDELRVAFDPPRWSGLPRLQTRATVARVSLLRRRRDAGRAGMGLRFSELSATTIRCLDYALRGLPPPLPSLSRQCALDERVRFDDNPAVVQLDDGVCFLLCAEAPLLSAGRPLARVKAPVARPSRSHCWLEPRAHNPGIAFPRSPMTAIFEQSRGRGRCATG